MEKSICLITGRFILGLLYGVFFSPVWSIFFVRTRLPKDRALKISWLLPDKELGDGLKIIGDDSCTLVKASLIYKTKNFVLYTIMMTTCLS
jgi:hypothetical protein